MHEDSSQRLRTRAGRVRVERAALVDSAKRERRGDLTEVESRRFTEMTEELREMTDRIDELECEDTRTRQANAARRGAGGPFDDGRQSVYTREGRASYFADLVTLSRGVADPEARDRLGMYAQEQRDLNRADGSGGHFVPPTWSMNDYVGVPRPGRVVADLLNRRPLPTGTDIINIPRLVTGAAVAIQPADNDPVQEVDLTDSVLSAPVRTIAGQQDVAIQLLDQSPVNFDEIILRDLMADYSQKLNAQVVSGAGTGGQLLGLRNVAGIETVTWTSATPTVGELVKRVADATSRVSSSTFVAPNAVVMHPRRWAWITSQVDTAGRPFVVPTGAGPSNAPGLVGSGGAEGRVGELNGIPVYVDGGLPTNVNTNQDVILVLDTADTYLYESTVRTRVLPEVLSGTLTVRIQLWSYSALATRQAKSVAVITGTALTPPSFV